MVTSCIFPFLVAGYSLVIICSSQNEEKSPIISKLHLYRRQYGVSPDTTKYRNYLLKQFVKENQPSYQQLHDMNNVPYFPASVVDPNGYESTILIPIHICFNFIVVLVSESFLQVEQEWGRLCLLPAWLRNSRLWCQDTRL